METNQTEDPGQISRVRITLTLDELKDLLDYLQVAINIHHIQEEEPNPECTTFWLAQGLAVAFELITDQKICDPAYRWACTASPLPENLEIIPRGETPPSYEDHEQLQSRVRNLSRIWARFALAQSPGVQTNPESLRYFFQPIFANAILRSRSLPESDLIQLANQLREIWYLSEADVMLIGAIQRHSGKSFGAGQADQRTAPVSEGEANE